MSLRQAGRRVRAQLRRTAERLRWAVRSRRSLRRSALAVPPDRQVPSGVGRLGERSIVEAPTRIAGAGGIEIGDDVSIRGGSGIEVSPGARLVIEDHVRVGAELEIVCTTGIRIGTRSVLAGRVSITDTWSTSGGGDGSAGSLPCGIVEIGPDVRIGTGAIIGPGVRIGAGATIAAGAVVFDDVPADTLALGNPSLVGPIR